MERMGCPINTSIIWRTWATFWGKSPSYSGSSLRLAFAWKRAKPNTTGVLQRIERCKSSIQVEVLHDQRQVDRPYLLSNSLQRGRDVNDQMQMFPGSEENHLLTALQIAAEIWRWQNRSLPFQTFKRWRFRTTGYRRQAKFRRCSPRVF